MNMVYESFEAGAITVLFDFSRLSRFGKTPEDYTISIDNKSVINKLSQIAGQRDCLSICEPSTA